MIKSCSKPRTPTICRASAPRRVFVQIGGRLVEEGDADTTHLLEQRQPYCQRRAHLLAPGQLRKGSFSGHPSPG